MDLAKLNTLYRRAGTAKSIAELVEIEREVNAAADVTTGETLAEARERVMDLIGADLEAAEADEAAAEREAARLMLIDRANELCDAIYRALRKRCTPWHGSDSQYCTYRGISGSFPLKIRVSDHAQPENGGYRVVSRGDGLIEEGRFGRADVDFRVTSAPDWRCPTTAEIRATIAAALRPAATA